MKDHPVLNKFSQLESLLDGRLGVFTLDTSDGAQLAYRAHERFPMKSTFKVFVVAAILDRSARDKKLLQQSIHYTARDMVKNSPITEKNLKDGMTVAELIRAVMRYSDNTATNLLMKIMGGPAAINQYARSLGDEIFRIDHWAASLNEEPDDIQDTSTPEAMGNSLQKLMLGNALKPPQRAQLCEEFIGNTIGATCIRSGIPQDWKVGNKTGAGGLYGIRSDMAILWPTQHAPVILSISTIRREKDAEPRDDVIASATRLVVNWIQQRPRTEHVIV